MLTKVFLGSVLSVAMIFAGYGIGNNFGSTSTPSGSEEAASCCANSEVSTGDKADCCAKNLTCCEKGKTKACCVATARIGCCAKGMKCCENNAACCSSVQECCRAGAACCDEGKACCGKTVSN